MLKKYGLRTAREGFTNVTSEVERAIAESGISDGICLVYSPHTTAGITINENADPDVVRDMLVGLAKAFPDRPEFLHGEGNSSAHLRASCVGSSVTVIVEHGRPLLGTWQGIYFCEFDGPRDRIFYVKITE
jgi:secondary thiamine-phosphate synthase enzyme